MADVTTKATEDAKKKYAYDPSKYDPTMGTKDGRVDEIRAFFHVIPGHEKAIREGILKFS